MVAPSDEPTPPTPAARLDRAQVRDDPVEAQLARQRLVRSLAASLPSLDDRVIAALSKTPRHLFMPLASLANAYEDHAHPIGYGQTISQPTVVAIMSDALALTGAERVLEIGTGSGYQAAVLSLLAKEVFSIEIVPELGEVARRRLEALGYSNVRVKIGDGYQGWSEHAPFDRVILTAAPRELPHALVEQLRDGGLVVAPVGEEEQFLYRWTKSGGGLRSERLGAVRFVPMVSASPIKD